MKFDKFNILVTRLALSYNQMIHVFQIFQNIYINVIRNGNQKIDMIKVLI